MKLKNDKELIVALVKNDFNAVASMIKSTGINSTDRDGRSILTNCVAENKIDFVKKMLSYDGLDLNMRDNSGYTALHFAVQNGNADMVLLLLENKADIDIQDNLGNTPLWRAVSNNPDDRNIINMLIKHGANVNIENHYGIAAIQVMKEDTESGDYDYSDILPC
jgi:ankyrin repeat protein